MPPLPAAIIAGLLPFALLFSHPPGGLGRWLVCGVLRRYARRDI